MNTTTARTAFTRARFAALILTLLTGMIVLTTLTACNRQSPELSMAAAKAFLAKKDYAAARVELKNVLQRQESGEAQFLLGLATVELGDYITAESHFRRAISLKYADDAVPPALARVMLGLGNYRQLTAQFAAVTLADPAQNAVLKTMVGEAYLALSLPADAAAAFAAALASMPGEPRARIGEARVLAATGKIAAAAEIAEQILAATPGMPQALALKADLLVSQNRIADAKAFFTELIGSDPYNGQARFGLISLAMAENDLGAAETGIAAMKKTLPGDVRWRYLEAVLAFRRNELTKAQEAVTIVLKLVPDHAPSLLLAGAAAYSQGSLSTAEDYLRKVLAIFPGSVYARNLLVATYLRKGQPAKAEETLAPALRTAPNDPTVLRAAGEVAFANNRIADAARFYEQALTRENDKEGAGTRTRLAQIRLAGGDSARALDDLEVASGLDKTQFQADLSLVAAHLQRKEYDRALAAVAVLEKKQPTNPLTHSVRGAVLVAKADARNARIALEKALELQFNYLPAARILANLDIAEKKPAAAKARFESIIAREPGNDSAVQALAEVQAQIQTPPREVAATIERAIKLNPGSGAAHNALIRHYSQQRETKAALAAALKATEALPADPQLLDTLGLAQLAAGEPERAIETFSKLAKWLPDSPMPLVRLASAQYAAKQVDAPIQALRKALSIRPDLLEAQRDIVAVQLAAGRTEEALQETRALQRMRPREAIGFSLEGDVLTTQKRHAEAANAYAESVRRQPDANVAVKQHQSLVAAGKSANAAALAARWLKENPQDPLFRFHLANGAVQGKDFSAAAQRFRELLAQQPDNPALLNNLAWVLSEARDPAALGYAERAYAKAPTNPDVQDTYGWLLIGAGETKRGLELLGQAVAAKPDAAEVRMHLAKGLLASGDRAGARKELDTVIRLGSNPGLANEARDLLKTLP